MEKRALGRATSSGRSDDNPETIKKRIETFVKITTPLVNWFQSQNKVEVIATD
jgi:UMP-CMP kinase